MEALKDMISLLINCSYTQPFRSYRLTLLRPDASEALTQLLVVMVPCAGYRSLADRKENRESAWRKPGWDEVVAYTVPLIEEYYSRILTPNTFSPSQ